MAKLLGDYIKKVGLLMKDKSEQTDSDDIAQCIDSAIQVYQTFKQRTLLQEYTASGGRLYDLPTGWQEGVSEDYEIEYPVSDLVEQVTILDRGMSELYPTPPVTAGDPPVMKIRFRSTEANDLLPQLSEKFRVRFPVAHILTTSKTTIPDAHFMGLSKLAARELCLVLASRFAQQASGLSGGDAADYRDKSDKMLKIAEEYFQDFKDQIVPQADDVKAAGTFGEFIDNPLHKDYVPTFPRDADGHLNL